MIVIDKVSFTYEHANAPALDGVSLTVNEGEFIGIIGESGSGKTTLGRIIDGVVPHHFNGDFYGTVQVDGLDTFETELTDLAVRVGTVSQDIDSQMVAAEVRDEILYGLENFSVPEVEAIERMTEALDSVGASDLVDRRISTLSGGQKQKVAIAAIMALKPRIILLDEPTGELDPVSSRQIFELLRALNNKGTTVIVIEQKVMLLCEYAERLVVMNKGRIALEGSVAQVLACADEVDELGINRPRVSTLCSKMNKCGIGDGRMVATVDQARAYIEEVLS